MDIENLTLRNLKQINSLFKADGVNGLSADAGVVAHPMLGRRCLVRTYSAGVHIGDVVYINPNHSMECKLENALRLWKWEGGGLSLSAVAKDGIKDGRLNETGDVYLTNAIEYIPTTEKAEESYVKFIES